MTYRYLRKKKWEIFLIIVTVLFLYILSDGFGSSNIPLESYDVVARVERNCLFCREVEADSEESTNPEVDVNIVDHLKLSQVKSNNSRSWSTKNTVHSQVCKRPHFDLRHDSVKYAFFSMPKLNCSKKELFYIENNVFRFNITKLEEDSLAECLYFGIERVTDDFSQYTDPLTVNKPPFDIILKHDFIRIKCYLKSPEEESEATDIQIRTAGIVEDKYNNRYNTHNQNTEVQNTLNKTRTLNNTAQLSQNVYNTSENISSGTVNKSYKVTKIQIQNNGDNGVTYLNDEGKRGGGLEDEVEDIDNTKDVEEDKSTQDPFYDELYGMQYEKEADFDQLLVQIHPKSDVFQRISKLAPKTDFQTRPNILMFGLDSMSHLSYQRKLPLTYKYLKETLGSAIMDGYNIVGDATTAALIPILTGKCKVNKIYFYSH